MNLQWLARVAASAAVRRLVYLAIAGLIALLLSFMPTSEAHAQAGACNAQGSGWQQCSRQDAYEDCKVWVAAQMGTPTNGGVIDQIDSDCVHVPVGSYYGYLGKVSRGGRGTTIRSYTTAYMTACPAGNVWDEDLKECAPSACQDAPDYGGAMSKSFNMCSNGCRYEQGASGGVNVCLGSGADMTCIATNWKPTGGACKPNDKPPQPFDPLQETCRSLGGGAGSYSECVKPNGDHCVTSAKGSVLCWKPSDIGDRMTTDGDFGGDREPAPDTPSPPENMQDPTQITTTTTTIGGTTYNTSIYNGTGNKGGQGNVGEGGNNTGGTGDPKGEGEGGDGDKDGPGGVGSGVGDLYSGDGKTVASVFDTFKAQVEASPLVGAAGGFLTVSVSASCPAFTVPETFFWPAMEFTYHCTGPLADALALGAYLLMAIAAYTAFKIGFG